MQRERFLNDYHALRGSLAGALLFTALGARLPRRGTFVLGLLAFAVADGFLVLQPPLVVAGAVLAALGIARV